MCAAAKVAQIKVTKEECTKGTGARVKTFTIEGCTNTVIKGGLCRRHGAKVEQCSSEGCTNQARNGGVCRRHGAKGKRCSREGCTNVAIKGGVCSVQCALGMGQSSNFVHKSCSARRIVQKTWGKRGQKPSYAVVEGAQIKL